ncbi:unnamed protein product [Macrosiphum euphorbiae]|uniref:DRBM domain-containing protein n=1 Tax=Macrosiphum euphorbiae TaxID=13131 RepID=A0AAV0XSY3_9HEMI|nr:unnamed protein product [Macrosiphum euphorbiae]
MANPKAFLHEWCAKNNLEPQFQTKQAGSEYKLQFICEVTVTGHNYIGLGNSNKKKSAQLDASKDYLLYLTRQGLVSTDSLPSNCISSPASNDLMIDASQRLMNNVLPKSAHQENETPNMLGDAYRPNGNVQFKNCLNDNSLVEKAESLDVHFDVCGNSTVDNTKFIQSNELKKNPKAFLQEWCAKNNLELQFEAMQSGTKLRPQFKFEITLTGHNYIGMGNSTNIKNAQENAFYDFLLYLTREGFVSTDSLPSNCISGPASNDLMVDASQRLMNNVQPKSAYQENKTPNILGEAYRPVGKANFQFNDFLNDKSKTFRCECRCTRWLDN